MARKKQRVAQHVMEDMSYEIIKGLLPQEHVVREFNRPDYGIDIVIELFDKIDDSTSETLGEFIYAQVKSVKSLEVKKEIVYPVGNVAKGAWIENKSEYAEIDVVKYSFDTDSIYTISTLGASVSVLLILVDIENKEAYFVCLNDYIDKIILPKNREYVGQETYTIKIPVLNNLKNEKIGNNALKFYGKRAKLLASFSKFFYQKNEIDHLLKIKDFPVITYREEVEKDRQITTEDIVSQVLFFIEQIEELDIWDHKEWSVLPFSKDEIIELKNYLINKDNFVWEVARQKIIICWHRLTNLASMYEEICREWFLPKMISLLTSYPREPEIIKSE